MVPGAVDGVDVVGAVVEPGEVAPGMVDPGIDGPAGIGIVGPVLVVPVDGVVAEPRLVVRLVRSDIVLLGPVVVGAVVWLMGPVVVVPGMVVPGVAEPGAVVICANAAAGTISAAAARVLMKRIFLSCLSYGEATIAHSDPFRDATR